jgi:Fibronectin type III domain/Putative collagen-binding domain of a collagenase/Protein of unknown function (DUF4038)
VEDVYRPRLRAAARSAVAVAVTLSTLALTGNDSADARAAASSETVEGADRRTPAAAAVRARRWPSSVAGRKVLDQFGRVYLIRTFSSWAMASHLTKPQITRALKGVAANRFNGVTVWIGGGANYGSDWSPRYLHKATGRNFWRGTPWASPLGGAWASLDHLVAAARRRGIFVWMSLNGGFGSFGARADWEAVTNRNMRRAGVAIARRYRRAPNVGWHVMFDDHVSPTSAAGRRIEAFFDGVNDTEGISRRPVRWVEVANGSSTNQQGWLRTPKLRANVNSWYEYGSNSTEIAEAGYAEVRRVPAGDSEPPYDGSPHYGGNVGQQLRERSYATFLEGGSLINYGHEDWWRFGRTGLYSEGLSWRQVQRHSHTVQQSRAWRLLDRFVARRRWVPDRRSFLTTGTGSGDTKAAAGRSATTAVAYFPSRRRVVVNTSVIAGTRKVGLRWYNPITGRSRVISRSEAQRTKRAVRYPRRDGTNDWVLVVSLARRATVPAAPRSLSATSRNRAARLSWRIPSSNGGARIADYVVQRSANGGRTWRRVRDGVSTVRRVTVRGLTSGHRYRFRVSARNRVGRGPWSAIILARPK